ncbi:hypothetical protein GGI21_001919, partial [Coemansia aciculifera]
MTGGGSIAVTSPTSEKPRRVASTAARDAGGSNGGSGGEFLSAAEREDLVNEAEWGFRKWLTESRPAAGYVMYPSTRQILKSLQSL